MIVTTEVFAELLAAASYGSGAWSPPTANLVYYGRMDTNAYQDLAQSVPATTWPQQVRQLRDARETPGGSSFPYLHWDASGAYPAVQPEMSNWGGSILLNSRMQLAGMPSFASANFTAIWLGVPCFDYPNNYLGCSICQIGDTFSTGVLFFALPFSTNNVMAFSTYHNATLVQHNNLDVDLGWQAAVMHSTGTNLSLYTSAAGPITDPASTTGNITGGLVADDARLTGNWMQGGFAGLLVYAGALDAPTLAQLRTDLGTHLALKSLWPRAQPLVMSAGDSRTIGTQAAPVTVDQSWPHYLRNHLLNPSGLVCYGKSGARIDQIDSACRASLLQHITAAGGPATRVVMVFAGTNDFLNGDSAATVLTRLTTFAAALKAGSPTAVFVATEIANNALSGGQATQRDNFNTSLRTAFPTAMGPMNCFLPAGGTTYADGMIDLMAFTQLQNGSDATYFQDGTHPTPLGYQVIAGAFQAALGHVAVT